MAEQKHTQDPLDMEEALSTSEAFLIKYKGRILGTIAAVVIIIAGFMGYKHFISDPNEVKASEALFKGEQYLLFYYFSDILFRSAKVVHFYVLMKFTGIFF